MNDEFERKLRAALGDRHKRQRGRRGKRKTGIGGVDGPGMMRRMPASRAGNGERQEGSARLPQQPPVQPIPTQPATPGAG